MISYRKITSKNIKEILALDVAEEQKKVYPRSNAYSIAEGHYPQDDDPVWMRLCYEDGIVKFRDIRRFQSWQKRYRLGIMA